MIKLIDILKEIIEGTCGYTTDVNTNKKLNWYKDATKKIHSLAQY